MAGTAIQADFSDRVVLVTGAASGIGSAVAARFVAAGATVCGCDISKNGSAPGAALFGQVDVSDESSVATFVAQVVEKFGRIDTVVNVAGVGVQSDTFVATHDVSLPEWQKVIDVNLTGTFIVSRATLPELIKTKGSIVNIASVMGLVAGAGVIAYTSSKFGVVGLTKGMALDYARGGVRVNAVCPGFVNTPLVQHHLVQSGDADAEMANLNALHPVGRIGEPYEIADAVLWAASDSASFLTGAAIPVDGAYSAA